VNLEDSEIDRLGRSGFEIQGEIGRGASGVVYVAYQALLDRQVALKRVGIDPATARHSLARLEREVAALVRFEHPGVVRLMDVQRHESSMWFVMEYVNGPTLRRILDLSPEGLEAPDSLKVIESLAAVLEYVSSRGIVHRDLKPANIFLTQDGRCKIGDFGIALLLTVGEASSGPGRLTAPGVVIGTPAYLSPEQVVGGEEPTSASDLYSLGVIAYELLVGRVPFTGSGNVLSLLAAQQADAPPRPRGIRPELSPAVEQALLGPLEKVAALRPPGSPAFWSNLKDAADHAWPGWESRADTGDLAKRFGSPAFAERTGHEDGGDVGTVEALLANREPRPPTPEVVDRAPPGHGSRTTRKRRPEPAGLRWLLPGAVFLVAVTASFLAAWALTVGENHGLRVDSIVLSVPTRAVSCSKVSVGARLVTSGGSGQIRYVWTGPGGSDATSGSWRVRSSNVEITSVMDLAAGNRTASSTVTFVLVSPGPSKRVSLPVPAGC
jgi:Protein kinase domain